MKINRENALRLWDQRYGPVKTARDFHGRVMYREAYGDRDFTLSGLCLEPCGWNIHHILPVALGGTDEASNLICTNIATNEAAGDKITFQIDNSLYQVRRIPGTGSHEIVKISKDKDPFGFRTLK